MFKEQQIAFDKFAQLKVGALFMQMGTGKTKVAIDLVNYNNVDLLIYICPYSVKENIKTELIKWDLQCDYILIGYETIQSSNKQYCELLDKIKDKKCFIIADESIFIKNDETIRFKRLCNIRNLCEYALILNGTPITKNEWDIYNQMYFLSPKIFNISREEFLNTFFTQIRYKRRNSKEHIFYKFSEINAENLYKIIKPYIFTADLNFDKKEERNIIYVDYTDDLYYREKCFNLKKLVENNTSSVIINMLNRLNIIATVYKPKLDKVIEYIRNKRVIVYCNYLEEIEYIQKYCNCYIITGNTTKRKEILDNFKIDNIPLIMTYGVGSYSLNLQYCNEIVYSGINFDYGLMEQSKYRIKRIGQTKDIKYTYILTNLGITKFILDNINKKKSLQMLLNEKIGDMKWLKYI